MINALARLRDFPVVGFCYGLSKIIFDEKSGKLSSGSPTKRLY